MSFSNSTPDLAPSDEFVGFDEFSRMNDLVEEYFDETIEQIALQFPITYRRLVAILAHAQLAVREFVLKGDLQSSEIAYESNNETMFWLELTFWKNIQKKYQFQPEEIRAAREVHRYIIEAVEGEVSYYNDDYDPVILVNFQRN